VVRGTGTEPIAVVFANGERPTIHLAGADESPVPAGGARRAAGP
jgi:hypothetical protein